MAFKMKGNPMQRNFGIGDSPNKKAELGTRKDYRKPEGEEDTRTITRRVGDTKITRDISDKRAERIEDRRDRKAKRQANRAKKRGEETTEKPAPTQATKTVTNKPAPKPDPKKDDPMTGKSFNAAFAEARKAGKKTFTWKGKSYGTKTKEDVAKEKEAAEQKAGQRVRPDGSTEAIANPNLVK